MRLLISFAALFVSVILLQLGSGGLGPLDALSGLASGFTRTQVGLLGSAHFFGFFIGCWWAPRIMGQVGHSRTFATFIAVGTIGIIAHTLVQDAYAWIAFRVMSGLSVAGCFTVIESWLQAKVTNENRGRTMGVYRVIDIGGSLGAQLLIGVLEPGSYIAYNLLAILCCTALIPIALTRASPPQTPQVLRLRPRLAWQMSPLAAMGVVVAGVTTASFRMVGPIYGIEVGLSIDQIALFLAAFVLGGALAQIPVGWLADKFDRRWILIWLSFAAIGGCTVMVVLSSSGTNAVMLSAALFGFTTFPIFSVSAAHAHDFATPEQRVELSAALMFLYALGAIASPYVASTLIENYGPKSMFYMISVAHILLILFGLTRMRKRSSPQERTAYVYTPRTSFMVGRIFGRFRDRR
ncbi:MAG: MFS transporter [Paracoccaceae bacterium]